MKKTISLLAAAVICAAGAAEYPPNRKIVVKKAENMVLATAINSPQWAKQESHRYLTYITDVNHIGLAPLESGKVRYMYDDRYLYVRAEFEDSDVITIADTNGGHFYIQGDVLEVFVKPFDAPYYWEIYGTPNKLRTRFHYPGRGTLGIPSGFIHSDENPIFVDAAVNGTLNDSSDRDKSWTVLVAIPRKELERYGKKFAPGNRWLLFSSRYNYSRYLNVPELSSFPQITSGYHSYENYAEIVFEK